MSAAARKRWCLNGGCFMYRQVVDTQLTGCLVCDRDLSNAVVVPPMADNPLGDVFDAFFGGPR